ncbi:MAG: class I SAM-dependent methyltransferase [Phenylobacterium sp.]|uniref:class I SAM-dependent methyltransferase n=1 Tax=Phenylobacterium sp. TaxID=1871053 RepID=UPI0027354E0A|nr:class I SAM-dependent methyltransferase [Phenylobacterium sp.]MDP3173259.1 class I SAM-dependent methyltransferase [Phenylobacterium sp.]
MQPSLVHAPCPVCGHTVAADFFDGGLQPLATLGWPQSASQASGMSRLPHQFVQCPACSHVWNRGFRYDAVPYRSSPNRMFNDGSIWRGHLAETSERLLALLPQSPSIVEIGCGEGHFLRGLARASGGTGRFVGFDPSTHASTAPDLEFHARLFEPLSDMAAYAPDAVVIRHVIEHLTEPAALLEQFAWAASRLERPCWMFVETPCIDRVFETARLVDFFYEHASHFTTQSFRTMMARAGEVVELAHGYDGEVVYALVRLGVPQERLAQAAAAQAFRARVADSRAKVRAQLDALAHEGLTVAIWGGTGKAAAFIHQFGADAERFPLVVDSDPEKAGSFVPGAGQEIVFRDVLKDRLIDVVIVPSQWRARDILAEMDREGIRAERLLIEHEGRLVDFVRDAHGYR